MFDLGKGDKEKLEENMEEIKQLVNEGQDTQTQENNDSEDTENFNPDLDTDNFQQTEEETFSEELNSQNNLQDPSDNPQQIGNTNFNPPQQNNQQNNIQNNQQNPRQNNPSQNQQNQRQQDQSRQTQKSSELDQEFKAMREEIKNEISSIEETQRIQENQRQEPNSETQQQEELETSQEMEKESFEKPDPLFLEVENFEDIKQMVEEMHYLTSEMDDVMQHLEAGIKEDKSTVTEANQILKEFQSRSQQIQNTLKNN